MEQTQAPSPLPSAHPLTLAVNALAEGAIYKLLEGGASPNIFDPTFGFPLAQLCYIALDYTSEEDPDLPLRILRRLLQGGAAVNAQPDSSSYCKYSRFGATALHIAARNTLSPAYFKEILLWGGNITLSDDITAPTLLFINTLFTEVRDREPFLENLHNLVDLAGGPDRFMEALQSYDGYLDTTAQCELALLLGVQIHEDSWYEWSPWGNPELHGPGIRHRAASLDAQLASWNSAMGSPHGGGYRLILDSTDALLRVPETQKTGSIDAFISMLRTLDHVWPLDDTAWPATLSLGRFIRAWEGEGIEDVARALLDVGANSYHQHGSDNYWFDSKKEEFGGWDLIALSAIYGRHSLLSLLLRGRPPPPPSQHLKGTHNIGHWLDPFDEMQLAYKDETMAVLACLKKGGLLGADGRSINPNPLSFAIKRQDLELVRQLLLLGVDVETKGQDDWRPLHVAISLGAHSIVRFLLENDAKVNAPVRSAPSEYNIGRWYKPWNGTPLHIAVVTGDLEAVRLLLDFGADVHATTGRDTSIPFKFFTPRLTPLEIALSYNKFAGPRLGPLHPDRLAIAQLLLDHGAEFPKHVGREWGLLKATDVLSKFADYRSIWDVASRGSMEDVDPVAEVAPANNERQGEVEVDTEEGSADPWGDLCERIQWSDESKALGHVRMVPYSRKESHLYTAMISNTYGHPLRGTRPSRTRIPEAEAVRRNQLNQHVAERILSPPEEICIINEALPAELFAQILRHGRDIDQDALDPAEEGVDGGGLKEVDKPYHDRSNDVDSHCRRDDNNIETKRPHSPFEILASHVCRCWREVAINTTDLWSCIKFAPTLSQEWGKQRAYLKRAQGHPLTIEIGSSSSSDYYSRIFDMIVPLANQWRQIDIRTRPFYTNTRYALQRLHNISEAPMLEVLRLQDEHICSIFHESKPPKHFNFEPLTLPFHGRAPNLRSLDLRGVHVD
ncbi:hypothetical protein BKA70DRAFT_1422469 [Coprinopsis sp. MPI-PUGE-AT-0042]|nr:hypothetical protein BKA70DRAFT_1422469 [Coprinopsis sp. MPI-PUGE-AT-0042]